MGNKLKYTVAAVILFVLGVANIFLTVYLANRSFNRRTTRLLVPGQDKLQLKVGNYLIFHEYRSSYDGTVYSSSNKPLNSLELDLTTREGERVSMREPFGSASYSHGGRQAVAISCFTINEAGSYALNAKYKNSEMKPKSVIAFVRGFTSTLWSFALLGSATAGIPCILSLVLLWKAYTGNPKGLLKKLFDITGVPHPVYGAPKHSVRIKKCLFLAVIVIVGMALLMYLLRR